MEVTPSTPISRGLPEGRIRRCRPSISSSHPSEPACFYALRFCQERNLSTEGLGLTLEPLREGDGKRMTALRIAVELPKAFPEKYRDAIERAIDHCAVKSQIVNPPRFELHLI